MSIENITASAAISRSGMCLAGLLLAASMLAGCGQRQHELLLATPAEPISAEIMTGLAERLGESSAIRAEMTIDRYSEEAALDSIEAGRVDIALVSNNLPFRNSVETLMPLYPAVLHIAYRAGRDTASPQALLRDATVFAGLEGSSSRLIFEQLVTRLGVDRSSYVFVDDPAEVPDVIIVFAPISTEEMEELNGYRLYSMARPSEIGTGSKVDAAILLNPTLRPFIIPAGIYGEATPEAVVTVAVDRLLVARHDLPSSVVYDFIAEVLRLKPTLAATWPGIFFDLSEDFDVGNASFKLHGGTLDYLNREAPTVYERYSGVAEVIVTLILALASATVAGVRIYNRYRKNRIDSFCIRAIELRDSLADGAGGAERREVVAQLRDLQTEAFSLLADEKLAADESFQIFITLSNDAIAQVCGVNATSAGEPS